MIRGRIMCQICRELSGRGLRTITTTHCNVVNSLLQTHGRLTTLLTNFHWFHISSGVNYRLANTDELVTIVTKCFKCRQSEAKEFCAELRQLKKIDASTAKEHLTFLKRVGIDADSLFQNPWLMTLYSTDIEYRMVLLEKAGFAINSETVPLLKLGNVRLAKALTRWHDDADLLKNMAYKNRLQFLAHHLCCTTTELLQVMDVHYPLLTMDFGRMERILKSMLQGGVLPEDIKRDLWIFRHNENMIMNRLERTASVGVRPVKTWMLRCPETILAKYMHKWHDTQDVLGHHKDSVSYLADRLQCKQEDVMKMAEKHPQILSINLPKMKQVLDFIFSSGFSVDKIYQAPRVLCHSIATMQARLQELNSLGYKPNHLRALFTPAKYYTRLTNKLRKEAKATSGSS